MNLKQAMMLKVMFYLCIQDVLNNSNGSVCINWNWLTNKAQSIVFCLRVNAYFRN